jgi:hypothetical protein
VCPACDPFRDSGEAYGQTGGLPRADAFLQTWVPKITTSRAFKEDGLLMVIFDEPTGGMRAHAAGRSPVPQPPSAAGPAPAAGGRAL